MIIIGTWTLRVIENPVRNLFRNPLRLLSAMNAQINALIDHLRYPLRNLIKAFKDL